MYSSRFAFILVLTVVAAACGGEGSSPTAPSNPTPPATQANRATGVITSMTVSPAFGIAGITQFNFASSANDADGDPLTYTVVKMHTLR